MNRTRRRASAGVAPKGAIQTHRASLIPVQTGHVVSRAVLWKRWRTWALVLGIFALGIPLSTATLVQRQSSRDRLHDLAASAIKSELGLDATIGTVSLQLVPLTLVGRDITLDDPVYGRFAEADELRIGPSFRALLLGALELNTIEVRGANLRLVVRNGQVRNMPRAEGGPPGGGGPTLPFDELRVVGSTLTVDAEPHASGQLREVNLTVSEDEGAIVVRVENAEGWVRHREGRQLLERLEAEIAIAPDRIRVASLTLETPELRVAAREASAPIPFAEHGYEGDVEIRYDLAHLARLPLPEDITLPALRGTFELAATLGSEDGEQRARGTLGLAGGGIEEFGLGEDIRIAFDADRRQVRILEGSEVLVAEGGGTVGIEGRLSIDPDRGFPLEVQTQVNDLSFARLMSVLGVTENAIVEWIFRGSLSLTGTLVPLSLEGPVRLSTRDFVVSHDAYHQRPVRRVIGVSHGDFVSRWSILPDAVRFTDLVGDLPRSTLRGDVLLGFDNKLQVQARADVADLRDITPLDRFPIEGVGVATAVIDGTFQDPKVTGNLRFADFLFDEFQLGDLETDAVLDPDGLGVRFTMVSATKNESRYRAEDLYLDFHDDRFSMTGLLHLDGLRLADFYEVFGFQEDERFMPYQGLARGQADIRYTNGFPGDSPSGSLHVNMNLGFDHATLDGYRFTDGDLVGQFRWLDWSRGARGAELDIAHLSLRKGDGTLALDGRMSLGGNLQLDAVADRIALRDLEGIGDRFTGLDGVATVIGRIGGTFDVMRADFDIGVTNVTYDGRSLGDGRFFARLTDREDPWVTVARTWDRAHIPSDPCAHARAGLAFSDWPADPPVRTVDGLEERLVRPMAFLICGNALDGRLEVDLAMGRTQALPLRGVLSLDRLDLGPFLPANFGFEGRTSGRLTFDAGALKEPETLEGSVVMSEVRFARDDIEIRNSEPIDLLVDGGALIVNRARFVGPDSRLGVRGRASLQDGFALNVDGELDLGILARLTESLTASSGHVEARLNITGPLADPELYGHAQVSDAGFRFASFEPPVERLEGRIEFSQRSVLFEDFTADVAGGRLTASGQAALREQELERYHFDVAARGLRYAFAEGIDASFGARTRLAWSQGERLPVLSGAVSVERLSYTRDIEMRSLLGEVASRVVRGFVTRERTEVRRYDPDQDSVALDLRVLQGAPFHLQNNLVDADVRIDGTERPFRITGTDQRFGLLGSMEITRGRLFFQNNEFEVRRGMIRFDDATRIDPHLDVEASTEIRRASDLSAPNFRVMLSLVGPTDNLRLRTRSEPELPEQDILMLLAFGMTRGELQQLQESDVAGAAAIEAITSVTGVDREVRRALPLIDDFRVTTGYSQRTGRTEPRVSVGKRIAERVRLSATTGLSESREFRGSLEVQLDDNQRVGVSYDNYNNVGNSFGNLGIDWGVRLEFE